AYIFQTHWTPIGEAVWGRIKGNLTDQTDLIDSLNVRQRTLVNGYGWVINGGAGTFDSAHVRKVDTMYRLNDSTIAYRINGARYTALLRGTAAGGINSLVLTVPTVIFSNPITFSNSGGSWTGVLALSAQSANTFLAGPTSGPAAQPTMRLIAIGDLPTGIPNGNLQNSTIGFNLDNTGTVPLFSGSSVALGNTQILHLPYASPTTSGILSSTDYNRFSGGAEPVTSVNGQVGMVSVGNADTLGGYPIDFTNFHNGWVLAVDTIHSKLVFQSPGAGTGITSINGLNAINQTVVVVNGGSGTAPNIQSVTATHTINIPIVSGADSGIATPDMFGRWNALVTDSGFAVFIGNNTTHVPIQKYTSGTNRYIVGDTSASNPGAIVTQSSRQKLSDSLQLLIAAHTTDSGFQVLRTPLTNTPLAKFVDGSGHRFVEWDTIPTNPGAIVTSASRQKLLDSLNLVFRAAFVANLLKVQYLGYDFYANHPTGAGTMGVFIARDSIPTGAMFWDSAGIMTNLTPYVTLSVRGKGQPGDTTMITLSGSILTGFNINVAAMRDSVGSCVHHIFNADGSITFYSTCVLNNGASTGIK